MHIWGMSRPAVALAATALLTLAACSPSGNDTANGTVRLEPSGWLRHDVGVTHEVWRTSSAWGDGISMHMAGVSGAADLGGGLRGAVGSLLLTTTTHASGFRVEPGQTYTVSTPVKIVTCPEPGLGVWGEMFFFTAGATRLKQVNGPTIHDPCEPGERTITVSAKAPVGAVYLQPTVVMATGSVNDDMEFFAGAATMTTRR